MPAVRDLRFVIAKGRNARRAGSAIRNFLITFTNVISQKNSPYLFPILPQA